MSASICPLNIRCTGPSVSCWPKCLPVTTAQYSCRKQVQRGRTPGVAAWRDGRVRRAREQDTPVEGVCLDPILNHASWDDDRPCPNGLWDGCGPHGERQTYTPLLHELRVQGLENTKIGVGTGKESRAAP